MLEAFLAPLAIWLEPLFAPLFYPLDPSRRLFIGFLIVAMGMALLFYCQQYPERRGRGFIGFLFPKVIWKHRSCWVDVQLLFANALVAALVIAPLLVSKLVVVVGVAGMLQQLCGDTPLAAPPYGVLVLSLTVTLFLVEDFKRFIMHYAYHKIALLWRFHRVHHSAEVLTPLTLYRCHPVEMLLSRISSLLVIGGVTGLFLYLFPGQLSALEILGVDALGFLFNALGANLRHSHIPFSFGSLERWIISPRMHQIHHSRCEPHRDKNFGSCLAIWDRTFGSAYLPRQGETWVIGCHEGGRQSLMGQWMHPMAGLAPKARLDKAVAKREGDRMKESSMPSK